MIDQNKKSKEGLGLLMETIKLLEDVSKDEGLYINYAKICWGAMKVLKNTWGEEYCLPIDVEKIYDKIGIEIKHVNLNEFMEGGDDQKVNRIIGKISIRPDYISDSQRIKTTVYVDEEATPASVNYALAHELCHLILNYKKERYTDDYCIMPMLPKVADELVADAFAVFLLIPFDLFLDEFNSYVSSSKIKGLVPIGTKEWLTYLSSVALVPNYYVTCAYEQIRQVAFLIYKIFTSLNEDNRYKEIYGKEIIELYDCVKEKLSGVISLLYQ